MVSKTTSSKSKKLAEVEVSSSTGFEIEGKLNLKPIGSSGTQVFAGYFSEEYLQKLRGEKGAKIWDEMRRSEPQVAMLLNAIFNPIKSANWAFEGSDTLPDSERQVSLLNTIFKDRLNWEKFLQEALTCVPFGFSLFEMIDEVVFNHPKLGTFNGVAALGFRSQKTIQSWKIEPQTGRLLGVEQNVYSDVGNSAFIPGDFLVPISLQQEGDNYEGISALRPMYGPWFRKNLYQRLAAIGVEKYAVGVPIGKVPSGKEKSTEFNEFKKVLSAYTSHECAYIIMPSGWEVEIQKGEFDASEIKELLVFENTEMVNAVVANFLVLGLHSGGGAYALGTDLSDFFLSGIQSYADLISGVFNRLVIPSLIKKNFGPQDEYPKLKCTGINDKAGKEFAEIIQILTGANAIKPDMKLEEFLRNQFKLPKADLASSRLPNAKTDINVNPNLPKQEAGSAVDPGVDVQKLSLNGAQVASLLSIVQRVAIGLLPRQTGVAAISEAFNMSSEQAERIMGNVGQGFVPNAQAVAGLGAQQLSDRIQLADSYKKTFKDNKEYVKEDMQSGLLAVYDSYKSKLKSAWNGASPSQRVKIPAQIDAPNVAQYKASLKECLAKVAYQAVEQARREVPSARNVKLFEGIQLAAPRGGYFDALPQKIKTIVATQAALIADTQVADLEKIVSFQFASSATGTEDIDGILTDIDGKVLPTIEEGATGSGMSIDVAASNAVAQATNQARMEFFFDPEVLQSIESFTFTNEDPVSEICQELAGTVFAANDPQIDQFTPPLHHNCKSRMIPNEKGDERNPEIDRGQVSLSKAAINAMTLSELYKLRHGA